MDDENTVSAADRWIYSPRHLAAMREAQATAMTEDRIRIFRGLTPRQYIVKLATEMSPAAVVNPIATRRT